MRLEKMIKNQNSMTLIIERPLLDVLGATPTSFVKRTVSGNKLILEFITEVERTEITDKAISDCMSAHGSVFKKLAE